MWWPPFAWSEKQQLLFFNWRNWRLDASEIKMIINMSIKANLKILLPQKLYVMDLTSKDCKIQDIRLSVFEPMQLPAKRKSWKSKIIFKPKQPHALSKSVGEKIFLKKVTQKIINLWTFLFRRDFSLSQVFCKKYVLINLIKLTGNHLCWSLFFDKVVSLRS